MNERPEKQHSKLRWRSETLATCATCACLLVADVATAQPCVQEVLLRDSIGTSSGWTDGNLPFATWSSVSWGNWAFTPVTITAPEDLVLTEWRVITSQMTSTAVDYTAYDYYLRGWSSQSELDANPLSGDLFNVFFDIPSSGPLAFGTTGWIPGAGNKTTYDIRFDLLPSNIQLGAGASIIVALDAHKPTSNNIGFPGIIESVESGASDVLCGEASQPQNCYVIDGDSWSFHDGRLGIEIRGQSGLVLSGDLDADGDVDLFDAELFTGCMAGPGQPNPGCDPAVFDRADIDDDTDTDMSDFAVLQVQFGQSCP